MFLILPMAANCSIVYPSSAMRQMHGMKHNFAYVNEVLPLWRNGISTTPFGIYQDAFMMHSLNFSRQVRFAAFFT